MMTSDSEDDYEDASQSQHHDNQVENTVDGASSSSSNVVADVVNSNQFNNDGQREESDVNTASSGNHPSNSTGDTVSPPEPAIAVDGVVQQQVDNDNQEVRDEDNDGAGDPLEFFRRLRGFLNDNPNPHALVVDSDSDNGTESDDSEMDFPMLNPDDDGESNRASSDDNETQGDDGENLLQEFDQELPIRHSYLGEGMEELQGRVVLEEDATPEIPLIDENLMGKVKVRPEIRLEPFVLNLLLPGVSRHFLPKRRSEELEEEAAASSTVGSADTVPVPQSRSGSISRFTFTRRDSVASTVSTIGPDKDLVVLQAKIQDQRKRLKYYSALSKEVST